MPNLAGGQISCSKRNDYLQCNLKTNHDSIFKSIDLHVTPEDEYSTDFVVGSSRRPENIETVLHRECDSKEKPDTGLRCQPSCWSWPVWSNQSSLKKELRTKSGNRRSQALWQWPRENSKNRCKPISGNTTRPSSSRPRLHTHIWLGPQRHARDLRRRNPS